TPASGSFTVPATALNGATRMRVSMKYSGIPTACEAFSYGEVEDYTVNITTSAREISRTTTVADITLYPNPANDILNLTNVSEKATFRIFNLLGQEVLNGSIRNNSIAISTIATGNYILEIQDNDTVSSKRFIKQ
ncbi:MAG: T9SS type A sorting domain-containing protein, partial [Flavobacterium sp.]|nr:T9SS type A sorting domain-containing protein [Flavobacterium sp.]